LPGESAAGSAEADEGIGIGATARAVGADPSGGRIDLGEAELATPEAALAYFGLLPADIERRARVDLAKESSTRRLAALLLRSVDKDAAEWLDSRRANLIRKEQTSCKDTMACLRGRNLQRADEEASARVATREEDRERERLALEIKLAKSKDAAA